MKRNSMVIALAIIFVLTSYNNTNTGKNDPVSEKTEKELIFDRGDKIDSPNFTGDAWLNNLVCLL